MDGPDDRESARLAALDHLDLDNPRPEPALDAIAALAAAATGCATAIIAVAGETTFIAKAIHGAGNLIAPRRNTFSDRVVRTGEMMIIPDTQAVPDADQYLYVSGSARMRSYAGIPIGVEVAGVRQTIGMLCVYDSQPRPLDDAAVAQLRHLALVTEALVAGRRAVRVSQQAARETDAANRRYRRQDRTFRQAERMARVGSWRYRLDDAQLEWSDEVYRIHGLEPGVMPPATHALDFYPPHARAAAAQSIATTIECGTPFDLEADFITAKGEQRRVRSMGELETDGGRPIAVIGVVQDVTERYRLEQSLRTSANIDEVTGIANRASFNRTLESSMIRAGEKNTPLMLALIDLDDFKAINDTHGHIAGDDVLRAIGARLRAPWLFGSFAARLGGDEFALIVEDAGLVADPAAFARRLSKTLASPATTSAGTIPISGTVGTSVLTGDIEAMRDLMHAADTALYDGKRRRRGTSGRSHDRRTVRA